LFFVFDAFAIGFLLAGDYTTTTFWRDVEFLQNYGHRQLPHLRETPLRTSRLWQSCLS